MGQWWPAAGLAALSIVVLEWEIFKDKTIIFIIYTTVWPQLK